MYTQCPYCSTSFRVTAEVLKQAAGKVRCGGCGNAFNALAHLSEEKPVPEAPAPAPEPHLPELKPEPPDADSPPAARPQAMSPEQSAALLKTLDELAGSDVRLEDTGIEWRVLDDDDERDDAPSATLLDEDLSADLESRKVDEVLTSAATPLDEVLDGGSTNVDSPEVFEESAGRTVPDDELRFDDNTGLPEDEEDFDDQAVAVTPVVPEPVREAPEPMANIQVDLGFGDPGEWQDLLEEVGPATGSIIAPEEAADAEPTLADELEALDIEIEAPADDVEEARDGDQLANQMEALSLELSGIQEELDMLAGDTGEQTIADELEALELVEDDADEEKEAEPGDDALEHAEAALELDDDDAAEVEEEEEAPEPELADDDDADDGSETSIDDDLIAAAFEAEASQPADESGEHELPSMPDDEQALNKLIDEELMALAVEDEDGFASTMVIGDVSAAETDAAADDDVDDGKDGDDDKASADTPKMPELPDDMPVEEIVMEGAIAHSGDLEEKAAEEAALKEEAAALIAAASAAEEKPKSPINWGLVAGIVVLIVLLALQAVHFSRNALARAPAMNDLLAPIYQAVGAPLTPAWDITGWDFEATRGSTDESGEVLSIFSRIGNNSESALPYPVISVSLTDRFEETIGSRVFEPAEYLADDFDPQQTVAPGTTFNALMLIESPADAATGFKLNVCYRLADRDLKCAIKDFR